MIFILIIITFALYALHNYIFNNEESKLLNKIPGPRTFPFVGNGFDYLPRAKLVPLFYFVRHLSNKYNGIYRMWVGRSKHVNVYNPQDIGILLSSQKHITKNGIYAFIHPWLKDGLLTSTGEKWQKRRKILTPSFHFNILKEFCNIFEEQSNVLAEKLRTTKGEAIDILPYITNFALNTICETSMGTNLDSAQDKAIEYKNAIYEIGENLVHRTFRVWLHNDFLFNRTPTGIKQKEILKTLHGFSSKVISERRKENVLTGNKFNAEELTEENIKKFKKRLAMLDLLLFAESEGSIDESGIREEVDTFMFEGHDTTTMAISFCIMLLANNPEAQKLAYEEVNSILSNCTGNISINDFNNMNYLERCIKEALRLYPSVPFIGRRVDEAVNLGKYTIPAGTECEIHIFDLHRDPKIYPNPLKFDPDRFLPENCKNRHPYAYIPFSAGPRNCIGQRFAILEEKAVISAILKNFILEPVTTPDDIYFSIDIVLRCRDAIKVKFIPRE